jgi:hypothetical protein
MHRVPLYLEPVSSPEILRLFQESYYTDYMIAHFAGSYTYRVEPYELAYCIACKSLIESGTDCYIGYYKTYDSGIQLSSLFRYLCKDRYTCDFKTAIR